MRTEVPEVKRACFCFPLRYSLLLSGYGRLIYNIITLLEMVRLLIFIKSQKEDTTLIYIYSFDWTLLLLDFILVVILIIGAHKKSFKLLKAFYFYDLGLCIVQTMYAIATVYWVYVMFSQSGLNLVSISRKSFVIASYLTSHLIFKGYVLLLVRSEFIKLNNTCQFRFVNNAAESECKMKLKITGDGELGLEKNNEGVFESKDNNPENMGKLTNKSEGNMKYKKICDEELETEDINNEETSKRKNTCLEEDKLAKESKCNMKYEKLGDKQGLL